VTAELAASNRERDATRAAGAAVRRPPRASGWAVRQIGIRAQLAVFSFLLVLVAAGGSAAVGWRIVDSQVQQATTERLNAAASTFNSLYQQRVADAELVTRQLSDRTQIAAMIRLRNSDGLAVLIEPIQTLRPFYSIVVGDRDGNVLAKIIPAGRTDPGSSLLDLPGVAEALEVDAAYPVLVRRQDCQMLVAVTVPVKSPAGAVVGLMHLRFPLDDEFVRQVKTDTAMDVGLYCGDTLIATTLPGQAGAIGSKTDPAIVQHVLEDGLEWEENLDLPSQTFRVRYVPLLGGDGKPLGMYGVAIPIQTLRDARSAVLRVFAPVVGGIAAFAILIGYLGSAALTRPLRRLAGAAAQIGSGDLESPVPIDGEDEVAQLAERMEEMRRSLRETYDQLRRLNRLKDEYLFSVAHEVRTPLTSLVASVEILAGDYAEMSPDEMAATVRRIERSAIRLQTLVENVLDAGSIRAGRFSIHPAPVPLRQILDGVVSTMQPLFDEKRQRLDVQMPSALPAVLADDRRIAQVFANLLSNASKYGPHRDLISIRATVDRGHVVVRITDHGPGIPLPDQGELFERYFRAASSACSSPGTGLGLAISKAIVEAHGGSVGLESDPDRGTTVWFTLPFASHAADRTETQAVAV
jgi:signal transduction histidine kinase